MQSCWISLDELSWRRVIFSFYSISLVIKLLEGIPHAAEAHVQCTCDPTIYKQKEQDECQNDVIDYLFFFFFWSSN